MHSAARACNQCSCSIDLLYLRHSITPRLVDSCQVPIIRRAKPNGDGVQARGGFCAPAPLSGEWGIAWFRSLLLFSGLSVIMNSATREDGINPREGCQLRIGSSIPQSGTVQERARTTLWTAIETCLLHVSDWLRTRCGVRVAGDARSRGEPGMTHPVIGGTDTVADDDLVARGYPWPSTRKRIAEVLAQSVGPATVLDLRAGPWPCADFPNLGDTVHLVSFDPLAGGNGGLRAQRTSEPAACGAKRHAEEFLGGFDSDTFDLVFARDWVDRCHNPQQVIRQMLRVVKPGGFMLMEHRLRTAGQQADGGLQRWGLAVDSAGGSDIRFHEGEICMSHELVAACQIECERLNSGEYWLAMKIHKKR